MKPRRYTFPCSGLLIDEPEAAIRRIFFKILGFGTGVGIEIAGPDLEIIAVRLRPQGAQVRALTIRDFASRNVAEWSAEYHHFLKIHGFAGHSATVLLPRQEVIIRLVDLPGVAPKDRQAALRLQMDVLLPFDDADANWAWSAVDRATTLVGIMRRCVIEKYVHAFEEAHIAIARFTFSPGAIYAAIRLNGEARPDLQQGFIAITHAGSGRVEIYGESRAKPAFSFEAEVSEERATQIAISEMRLPPNTELRRLGEVLPTHLMSSEQDSPPNLRLYATALVAAFPWLAHAPNLLPQQYRRFSSHRVLLPALVLATLTLLLVGAGALFTSHLQQQHLKRLNAEISAIGPRAAQADALDRDIDELEARIRLLDEFRRRTSNDLNVLNDLSSLMDPPIWISSLALIRNSVTLTGEAPRASGLLNLLDSSLLFTSNTFQTVRPSSTDTGETYEIICMRRAGQ